MAISNITPQLDSSVSAGPRQVPRRVDDSTAQSKRQTSTVATAQATQVTAQALALSRGTRVEVPRANQRSAVAPRGSIVNIVV